MIERCEIRMAKTRAKKKKKKRYERGKVSASDLPSSSTSAGALPNFRASSNSYGDGVC